MPSAETTNIFKSASTTYFTSSLFFPTPIKEKIFTLYAFVRTADDYIDRMPQDSTGFYAFRDAYYHCVKSGNSTTEALLPVQTQIIISNFVLLQQTVGIKQVWVDAFFLAMELDLYKTTYYTMQELQSYMYGSAEVVGLMICACVGLDSRAYPTARMLGRAMQYANFLRDIAEDLTLGRQYIPQEIVEQHGLSDLSEASTERDGVGFRHLYAAEERRYRSWNASAMVGFAFLKVPIRIPVATATKMYEWTIQTIAKNPYSVYTKKVKPSKARVLLSILENWFIAIVE